MKPPIVALAILLLAGVTAFAEDKPKFELVDGDRVVLIGGTMIERDQTYGYLETRLTRRYPDRNITFRNLGWSGDTVEGVSRAGFGTGADGFKHLVDHVLALKPTVIIVGYGANESFEGKAGLPKFLANLDKLLKAIEPTKARLVFLSPTRQENLGPPLPDPTAHNADLALYRDAIKAEAEKRGSAFVDLFGTLPDASKGSRPRPLTNNGIHYTPYGYWWMAEVIDGGQFGPIRVGSGSGGNEPINLDFDRIDTIIWDVKRTDSGALFRLVDRILPESPAPGGRAARPDEPRELRVRGLKAGRYILQVDEKPVAWADADSWKKGVVITKGPEFDQVEALRQAINAKNELYFYRWRPQNQTYLFGFRKHEQGQNAREIPLFDPLVAAKEAEIAKLRVPVPHVYELIREGEVGR
jgi:lysophospholipase L1-like esterase